MNLFDDPKSGGPLTNDPAGATDSMLEERPLDSCKVLCCHFRIGKATSLRILQGKLGLKTFHLRWVPHARSMDQKSERVSYSKLTLTALTEQKARGFQRIIAGNELSVFLCNFRNSVRAASHDELAQRIKHKIYTEKCLVSILWWVNRIHSLLEVSKGTTHNTMFITEAVMPRSLRMFGHGLAGRG
jgi:hypothetical protein